jgi:hypothetical protein
MDASPTKAIANALAPKKTRRESREPLRSTIKSPTPQGTEQTPARRAALSPSSFERKSYVAFSSGEPNDAQSP